MERTGKTLNTLMINYNASALHIFLVILIFFGLQHSTAQYQRTKSLFNKQWEYLENTADSPIEINEKENWIAVDLPHTWNATDATDLEPGYRRSASWYRKEFQQEEIDVNKEYSLYFEGANTKTKVFVNEKLAGEHIGGYLGFEISLTQFLTSGKNDIWVRVDNSYDPEIIPSQKSDFFIYGGIVRDVWFTVKNKSHISKAITATPEVSEKTAALEVDITVNNPVQRTDLSCKAVVKDPNGQQIASKTVKVRDTSQKMTFKSIKNPALWDIDEPNLYTLEISLLENDQIIDQIEETIGFRWFEFKKNGPFYLNGKRVLLRGTHRHEEHAGYGAAMPNQLHREDIKGIKEMGANFIRLAHYPQDPEVYKMCDQLGILVWDELPWCRGGLGNENWKRNTKDFLKKMIRQNQNHPSIIIWSLGNEIYWLPDFEGGDDTQKLNTFLEELNTLAHNLDPYRKTAIRKYYDGSGIVDVFSPSIWSGWYSGSYKTYEKAIQKYQKEYPHFLHAEYGGSSHYSRHTENPIDGNGAMESEGWTEAITQTGVTNIAKIGDWSENYIVDLFDWHLHVSEQNPTFIGNAQWAYKDFGTPLRPENDIPYINQKGIMDRSGQPKDAYYVFKSYWAKDPFVYIESHTWTERQGKEDEQKDISVYSNCPEVELFLNGESLGKKNKDISKFPACGLNWSLNFKEGNNKLIAKGLHNNKIFVDSLQVYYRIQKNQAAQKLELSKTKLPNGNYLITATAKDEHGLRCLDYEERVYFQCLSGGETLKHLGTPTGSEAIKMANGKAHIEVVPDQTQNPIVMTVLNQNFKGTYLKIPKT